MYSVTVGGFLPDIILSTRGTRLNAMKSFVFAAFMFPPKRFDDFSFCLGDAQKVQMLLLIHTFSVLSLQLKKLR